MKERGGGITAINLVDKSNEYKNYYQLSISFNTIDSMGANYINSCLESISKVCPQVSVIFDELPGEEARALEDFLDVNGGHIKFEGYASVTRHFPMQVAVQYDKGN